MWLRFDGRCAILVHLRLLSGSLTKHSEEEQFKRCDRVHSNWINSNCMQPEIKKEKTGHYYLNTLIRVGHHSNKEID